MDPTIQQLFERKSVRMFTPQSVTPAEKRQIIDAALQAPSAGNQTLYTILDVQDQALKEALAVSCDNQPFIAKAPLVLVFLADCRRWYDAYRAAGLAPRAPGPGDVLLACADVVIAAQNSVVAAHALGLGSCYIGDILEQKEEHTRLLALEPWLLPAAMVVYGYPTEGQLKRQKPPRFDAQYIVRQNRYAPHSEGELRRMFEEKEGPGYAFDEQVAAFCTRKYESDFSREMNRSAAEYLRQYPPFSGKE